MSDRPSSPATFMEFAEQFPDDAACEAFLVQWRWPDGFKCPECGHDNAVIVETRRLWQCRQCRRQTSITAGTVMHRTKTALRIWLYAFWLLARRKKSISALQFQRETGLRSYQTAWSLLHKVRRALAEGDEWPLGTGKVEVDESMVGGRAGRMARRLGWGGAWVVAAVERIERERKDGHRYNASGSARATVVTAADAPTLLQFVADSVEEGSTVVTDGLSAYHYVGQLGVEHEAHVVGGRAKVIDRHLGKIHLFFSNLKTWLNGTFHGVSGLYLELYVREYVYRFNRRRLNEDIFGFICRRVMNTPWTQTSRLLAEATG